MLKIADRALAASASKVLASIQATVDGAADYSGRVTAADVEWKAKGGTAAKKDAFKLIRETLASMCVGPVRCAYCEDSLADEVEHIQPKSLFPQHAFVWTNYLFACGPCNGPKSNRYGVVTGNAVVEFVRQRGGPISAPPAGTSGFIDPRREDPSGLLEVDLGGTTPSGDVIAGTFEILPADGLSPTDFARADFTIEVLGLNREVIRVARANAFGGFRARMREFVHKLEGGADADALLALKNDLLMTPHLTVFSEIRRQRAILPELNDLLQRAPDMLAWDLVPGAA